jgi:uncharacterized membrane protein YkoI
MEVMNNIKVLSIVLLLVIAIFGCNSKSKEISKEEVVSKIEKDSNKIVTSIEKENKTTYELEVAENNKKKTVLVDAETGDVKKERNERDFLDDKKLDFFHKDKFVIKSKEAREIALTEVQDATITEIEKEEEDGRFYYSVELMKNHINYSIDIDAKSGKISAIEQEDIFLND